MQAAHSGLLWRTAARSRARARPRVAWRSAFAVGRHTVVFLSGIPAVPPFDAAYFAIRLVFKVPLVKQVTFR